MFHRGKSTSTINWFFIRRLVWHCRELKQQRRQRLQKRHFKSEFAPLQTLSRIFHLVYFVKCWQMFLELNCVELSCIKVEEKKRKLLSSVPTLNKTWIQALSRCSRATTAKKCTKKAWCTCKVVVLLIKPIAFFAVLVAVQVVVA